MENHLIIQETKSNQTIPIIRVAVPGPFLNGLDYEVGEFPIPLPGTRVRVPLRNRSVIGVVLGTISKQTQDLSKNLTKKFSLKSILEIIDAEPIFSPSWQDFLHWASDYYHYPIGDCLFTAMPKNLCQGKSFSLKKTRASKLNSPLNISSQPPLRQEIFIPAPPHELTHEQNTALMGISGKLNQFQVSLIEGVTGSGKTEIYLRLIEQILKQNKQALILVPEIGLTPQTVERFTNRFSAHPDLPGIIIGVLHSQQTETEKLNLWVKASLGEPLILIGTRSALFTPFKQLGMIIIDEEHDLSFKQQSQWRYHARDLAIKRSHLENIPCVLGTATPSLETRYQALQGKYQHYFLSQRAGQNNLPNCFLIDLRAQKNRAGLTDNLIKAIQKHLDQKHQVLIFINRRGYAPALTCHECGHIEQCTRCDAAMTLHQKPMRLCCHHCGRVTGIPKICPQCEQIDSLGDVGVGTEKIETALINLFPNKKIIRIDKSNTSQKGQLDQLLSSVHEQEADILVGTQMIAKGHHFEHVSMVGIINIDDGLMSADFRGIERCGQLITQVAGRAGRAGLQGEVFIQTYQPTHPLLTTLLKQGYAAFADQLSQDRQAAAWPPYSYLALLHAEAKQAKPCIEFLNHVSEQLSNFPEIMALGPVPALLQKKSGFYRYHLLLQTQSRQMLHNALDQIIPRLYGLKQHQVRFSLDVDPLELG